jgi:hypothetical protein
MLTKTKFEVQDKPSPYRRFFMRISLVLLFPLVLFCLEAQALRLSEAKSATCKKGALVEFIMSFPQMRLDEENGIPVLHPGNVCYQDLTTRSMPSAFPESQVSVVQNGPNQSMTLGSNNGPIAYVIWGYVDGYDKDPATKGARNKWAPWDAKQAKDDLNCELSDRPALNCP